MSRKLLIAASILVLLHLVYGSDGGHRCPDRTSCTDEDSTCCKQRTGKYSCCPLASAVCCTDGFHCCPAGTTCNDKEGTCDSVLVMTKNSTTAKPNPKTLRANSSLFKFSQKLYKNSKVKGLHAKYIVEDAACPDNETECSSSQTCCKSSQGGYGCCPFQGAVCCSDHEHCCPHGSRCDLAEGRCVRKFFKVRLQTQKEKKRSKILSDSHGHGDLIAKSSVAKYGSKLEHSSNVTSVLCPGGADQCPDKNTCCKLKDGEWGCCPLPDALCCPDRVHCCPSGYSCVDTGCKKN